MPQEAVMGGVGLSWVAHGPPSERGQCGTAEVMTASRFSSAPDRDFPTSFWDPALAPVLPLFCSVLSNTLEELWGIGKVKLLSGNAARFLPKPPQDFLEMWILVPLPASFVVLLHSRTFV